MTSRLSYVPESIVGGESIWIAAANTTQIAADIILDSYTPAGGWSLSYSFYASTPLTVAAAANGGNTGWTLNVTGAQTLTLDPGRVRYAGYVSKTISSVVTTFCVDSGSLFVAASPLRESSWQAVLTSIDAAITTYAANPNGSIAVDGMAISYRSLDDLTRLRDYVAYRLKLDNGQRQKRVIRSRFNV